MEKVAEIMATIDLGVVPKLNDSFGNEAFSTKIMEFMAMNVPVIASRTRIDEHYFSDETVQFFEAGSAEDLAKKILYLMENSGRRMELCERSTEFIARNSWQVKQHIYLELVDRLVGAAHQAA
jgi:glycosyltransferase involved in cell wall biosynthesis